MQTRTDRKTQSPRVRTSCATCGGDPGGLVWEGIVLSGGLRAEDISTLTNGALDKRGVVRLFAAGKLRGIKIGKGWITTASKFVADWDALEEGSRDRWPGRLRRHVVVEVKPRDK